VFSLVSNASGSSPSCGLRLAEAKSSRHQGLIVGRGVEGRRPIA
jgi:hypothetical protein